MDFLHALDQIIERALSEKVDLVLFAGDAYKDRNPQPTFQREWGMRMMKLAEAGIPTLLLVGNHDVAPAATRAHTLQEYKTLAVPHMHVADELRLWRPADLEGVPVQILAVPWVSRSSLMTRQDTTGLSNAEVYRELENRVSAAIEHLLSQADPTIPLIVTAHATVQGAVFGSERNVMLGHEVALSPGLLRDKRIDYVALGHIHKHQELNEGLHPPIVYPGSIERIDFGEAKEKKGFVLAQIGRGETTWAFVGLKTRPFYDYKADTPHQASFMEDILRQLPQASDTANAVCRLQLTYPRDWEALLDEGAINARFAEAFNFHIQKNRLVAERARLGETVAVEELAPLALLETYWQTKNMPTEELEPLKGLAQELFGDF
jgi:DNA repair protein SbcD/Mre11